MFDSGIKKVWLTNNHYYRISSTIIIPSDVIVNGAEQRTTPSGGTEDMRCNFIWGKIDNGPLITIKAATGKYEGVTIKGMYLYRYEDASTITAANNYKQDIPTIMVDCTEGDIWGLYMDNVICVNRVSKQLTAADGTTTTTMGIGGYTGIEINATGGHYCTFITI